MANLSNELGISKNRKIEILLEMGYKLHHFDYIYHHPNVSGTHHWIKEWDLESMFGSDRMFIDFVNYKLTKTNNK
jgi:hypothetical protein